MTTTTDRLAAANRARGTRHLLKIVANAGRQRGNSPAVRRHSQYAGATEERAWRQHNLFSARDRRARIAAVTEWNFGAKKKGDSWGPMGPSGIRFLDSLMGLRDFKTGRLDLSIRAIGAKLRMCVQTVTDYVKRLVSLGLLVKLRRSRRIENPQPGEPPVEQITNAYWFQLPAELAERVRQLLGRGGKPACQEQHEEEQAAIVASMLATLSAEDLARFHAGDAGPLADALARLGRSLDQKAILTARE